MSSAKQPPGKEPASLQSTRQMLDELDALMDRMLALPVNDVDDPAPPPREIVRMPTVSATLTVLEEPIEEEEEAPAPQSRRAPRETFPSYTTDVPPSRREMPSSPARTESSPRSIPQPDPDPIPEEMIPPSINSLPLPIYWPEPTVRPMRPRRRSFAGYTILPLVWFNQGFDVGTIVLGPAGRWLRAPRGRHFLGFAGLTLLGLAGFWFVRDWLGMSW